jgi:hypothetical protein
MGPNWVLSYSDWGGPTLKKSMWRPDSSNIECASPGKRMLYAAIPTVTLKVPTHEKHFVGATNTNDQFSTQILAA